MEQYDGNDIKNIISPEQLKIWNMHHVLVIYNKVYFYTNDDNSFFWIKDEKSIIKKKAKSQQLWLVTSCAHAIALCALWKQMLHDLDSGKMEYMNELKIGLPKKGERRKG
ncbi:14510_t:CDS:2 [Gigaspora margarita]|uniref:14510_t:CDS:1 n=1 Tax=Gigaspora margarita TaxID=4874 RepID=A0ABN7VTN3_GIGMA|nr:14510_t:CDS:2 [Gigaspora margarita]